MMTGPESGVMPGAVETDFDKSIEDMVSQVRNDPYLTISKCVVEQLFQGQSETQRMKSKRKLSPNKIS